MRKITLLMLLLPLIGFSQTGINIIEGPMQQMVCDSNCIMLHATYSKSKKTNAYTSSTIPFAPTTITGTTITVTDDKFSNAIPIGFNFCFFENVYSQCYVSDNGVLTFESSYAGGNCFNNTQQTLPYFNSTCPDNAIFFMFMDVAPSLGGTIKYATMGNAPNRKFVIQYTGMKIFGATCSNTTSTYQVVLHELTNHIEVHITNKEVCDANTSNQKNYATIGLQNIGATLAHTISGKNASIFSGSNEGYRIQPNGNNDYVVTWKNAANTTIATNVDSLYFCPPSFPYSKVTASITYGCGNSLTYTDTISFNKYKPNISISFVQPQCNNATGSITISTNSTPGPFTYALSSNNFTSTNVFNNLPPGNYTCKVKDGNGCIKDTVITLQPINVIGVVIDSIKHPGCIDSTGYAWVHGVNGTPPYTYSWSNGQTGPVLGGVPQGTYVVTVIDANGCSKTAVVILANQNIPQLSANVVNPICGNSSGSITAVINGGTPSFSYLWSTNATTPGIANLSSGNYTLTVTDAKGCTVMGIFNLQDSLAVQLSSTVIQTSCGLTNGSISLFAYGGLPPYSFAWQPGGSTADSLGNLSPGTYTCTVTASNGCSKVQTYVINGSTAITNVISSANANCDSSNGKIYLLDVLNYTQGYSVLWSNGSTSNTISNLAPGVYWVKSTDSSGCSDIDTIIILNDGRPQLQIISYTQPTCYGDSTGSATFSGSNGVAPYKFSLDGINFSSVATMNNIPGGSYVVYLTDANSCMNDTLVNFPQPEKIDIDYIADTLVCYHDETSTITLSANNGFTPYQFAFADSNFSSQNIYNNNGIGKHLVLVKDAHNCISSEEVEVVGPSFPLDILVDKTDIPCRQMNLGAFNISFHGGWEPYTYSWGSSAFNGLQYENLGVVHEQITVTDSKGCSKAAEVNINQLYCCKLYIPNAFTPNADSKNDYFKPITVDNISSFIMRVYNRFGEVVYQSRDLYAKGWDGKDEGLGTYFYYIEYTCPTEKEKQILKGDVTLLR